MNLPRHGSIVLVASIAMALLIVGAAAPVVAEDTYAFEQETTVDADGEITNMNIVETVSEEDYEMIRALAEEEGYDSVGDWSVSQAIEQDPGIHEGEGWDEPIADGYKLHYDFTEVDVNEIDDISISATDDGLAFESTQFMEAPPEENSELTHTLVMPEEITDSNADEVSDTTAVWDLNEHSGELFAQTGAVDDADDEDDGEDDADTVADDEVTDDEGADDEATGDTADDDEGADDEAADDTADDEAADDEGADDEAADDEGADDEGADDEAADDTADDAADDSIPGLGAIAAVAGLLVATVLFARWSN